MRGGPGIGTGRGVQHGPQKYPRCSRAALGLPLAWLVLLMCLLPTSGCFDDHRVAPDDHPCGLSCRPCEQCIGAVTGSAFCQATSHAGTQCGDDGHVYWLDSCGEREDRARSCVPGVSTCMPSGPETASCECLPGRTGPNCQSCLPGFNPVVACTACKAHWTGEACDQCPPPWDPDAGCAACLPNWAGDDCQSCGTHWTGEACDQCPAHWDAANNCDSCLEPWAGANCEQCADNRDLATDCEACLPGWDIATGCTTCLGNRDPTQNCAQCANHWSGLEDDCSTCPDGWSAADDCKAVCGNGSVEPDEDCDDALHSDFCSGCAIQPFVISDRELLGPEIALQSDGSAIITWYRPDADGAGMGVKAAIIASDGTRGTPFLVNTTTAGNQRYVRVYVAPDDRFIIVWRGDAPPDQTTMRVYGQWFEANGAKAGGEIELSDNTDAATAISSSGELLVTDYLNYIAADGFSSRLTITVSSFSVEGLMATHTVADWSALSSNRVNFMAAAAGPDETFAVLWQSTALNAAELDGAVGSLGGAFSPFTLTRSNGEAPIESATASFLANGNLIVLWRAVDKTNSPGDHRIDVQMYSATGSLIGDRTYLPIAYSSYASYLPTACSTADGYVVAWFDGQYRAMRLDQGNQLTSAAFDLARNDDRALQSGAHSMACLPDGRVAFVWHESNTQPTFGQRIDAQDSWRGLFPW
ncbi:MAG: hypothetical protein OEZ06_20190 [Myxococcales bacterium]|nr:hypothetical protein [Myxococcales bacterium]